MNLHEFDIRREAKEEGARDAKLEAARNLLKMNLGTPEQIAQAQGLTLEEVLKIKEELNKD